MGELDVLVNLMLKFINNPFNSNINQSFRLNKTQEFNIKN